MKVKPSHLPQNFIQQLKFSNVDAFLFPAVITEFTEYGLYVWYFISQADMN